MSRMPRPFAPAAVVLSLCTLLPTGAAAQRGVPATAFAGESIDALIADFMRENQVPGMVLAIVQAPYITRATGYGIADPASGRLASPNTLFRLGRMADAYTAVAVMQLVESGKLTLDEPVQARLAAAPAGVTVRQLLARRDSATDAALLRELVATASGKSYESFVREHQIERLGLRHTAFASELATLRHERVGAGGKHREFLREPGLIDPTEPAVGTHGSGAAAPPGTLYASATEVSLWDIALAGEILIKDPALRQLLYRPASGPDGRPLATTGAWDFPGHPGLMVTTGGGDGFSSLLSRFTDPSELVCVTLLANKDGLDLTQLARKIAGAFDPRLGPPARAAGMRVQQSPYSVDETSRRLAASMVGMGMRELPGTANPPALAPPVVERRFTWPGGDPGIGDGSLALRAVVWEEAGEVWAAIEAPAGGWGSSRAGAPQVGMTRLRMRDVIDRALLSAASP